MDTGAREINAQAGMYLEMKTSKYEVFYSSGSTSFKTARVYKGVGAARTAARECVNEGADHIMIVGYDEMAHRNFEERLK